MYTERNLHDVKWPSGADGVRASTPDKATGKEEKRILGGFTDSSRVNTFCQKPKAFRASYVFTDYHLKGTNKTEALNEGVKAWKKK